MTSVLPKSSRQLTRSIRVVVLIVSIVFLFSASSVLARGGGHSGGHGGGHSGGHAGHSGDHRGHHAGHAGDGHRGILSHSMTRDHFTNLNPCVPTDKPSADCPQLGEKRWQTIPAEKTQNRFESRFD
jgi:hypothetical protein